MGAPQDPVAEFVAALREADAALAGARDSLAGQRIPDAALGKLFEAQAVRDAYHARLPQIERDIDKARAVCAHFVAGLEGGHHIVSVSIPGQGSGAVS